MDRRQEKAMDTNKQAVSSHRLSDISKRSVNALICVLIIFVFSISVLAGQIEDIRILKISPKDERAVIKTPDNKMRIIKTGDSLNELKVVEITHNRVVFEEKTDRGTDTAIIKTEEKGQKMERIMWMPDRQPEMFKSR